MTHPRLAVSEMCTFTMPFGEELALWEELGVRQVGLNVGKVETYGREQAISALRQRAMVATTVITGSFDLSSPDTWAETRAGMNASIDLAAETGGCVYFTPGRRVGARTFDELTSSLTEAVAPCADHARSRGVRLAIEPSLRTDKSFVHTLRDGLDVAAAAGIDVIADLGNCWMERDYEQTVRRAGARVAAVQFADAVYGGPGQSPPGGRAVPGDGDVPIASFLRAALDSGYTGAFELELVGPGIDAEGPERALRRAVDRASALLEEVL